MITEWGGAVEPGELLGLGTRYGVVRNWWVAVKFGLNIVLTLLIPV